jgi:hypothetical protein
MPLAFVVLRCCHRQCVPSRPHRPGFVLSLCRLLRFTFGPPSLCQAAVPTLRSWACVSACVHAAPSPRSLTVPTTISRPGNNISCGGEQFSGQAVGVNVGVALLANGTTARSVLNNTVELIICQRLALLTRVVAGYLG